MIRVARGGILLHLEGLGQEAVAALYQSQLLDAVMVAISSAAKLIAPQRGGVEIVNTFLLHARI